MLDFYENGGLEIWLSGDERLKIKQGNNFRFNFCNVKVKDGEG